MTTGLHNFALKKILEYYEDLVPGSPGVALVTPSLKVLAFMSGPEKNKIIAYSTYFLAG
jgi:hypothetical protein